MGQVRDFRGRIFPPCARNGFVYSVDVSVFMYRPICLCLFAYNAEMGGAQPICSGLSGV